MEENQRKTIGDNIRFYRMLRGFTQQELADILGVKYQQIQAWEKSGHKGGRSPKRENLERIATVLNVKLYDLYPEESKNELDSIVKNDLEQRLHWLRMTPDDRIEKVNYDDVIKSGGKVDSSARAIHAFLQLDDEYKHTAVLLLVETTNKCLKHSASLEFKHYLDALMRATESDSFDRTNNYDGLLNGFADQIEALAKLYPYHSDVQQNALKDAADQAPSEK